MLNFDIEKHKLQTFYLNNKYGWIGTLLLFAVFIFIMKVKYSTLLSVYIFLLVSYSLLHIINNKYYERAKNKDALDAKTWRLRATFISVCSGLIIGSMPVFYLDLNTPSLTYLTAAIIIMSMFGSSVVTAPCKSIFIVWTSVMVLPITLILILADNFYYNILGWMIIFSGVPVGLMMNAYNHKTLHETLELRFENVELMQKINEEKEKAEQANTDKSRFLAASSHDLRQPLHALDLFLGAITKASSDKEKNSSLDKAINSSRALGELLTALMDVSNIDAGKISINKEPINISGLVSELVDEIRPTTENNTMVLEFLTNNKNVSIYSDRVLLSRIIRNLIVNSIKHSQADRVVVEVCEKDEKVLINIVDNGIGIPDAEQKNIYSEFYQLKNPERNRNKGLGLGLSIVRRLAELLDHSVTLKSETNNGCHFQIIVPISVEDDISFEQYTDDESDISGRFIIIIDDDEEDIREAMRTLLKQWDCELLAKESLHAVEVELGANNYTAPDVLLVDYRLRDNQTGLQAIKGLRKHFKHHIPAIVVTGETSATVIAAIRESDCLLLNKPVSAVALKRAISTTVNTL